MSLTIPLGCLVVGLVLYVLVANSGKMGIWKDVFFWLFVVGLLWTVYALSFGGHAIVIR